ncbi:MAG: hypothetical protein IJU94_00770 [Clostridia bacterium]|nr:hypothetical protein [Clostridia bacterium]
MGRKCFLILIMTLLISGCSNGGIHESSASSNYSLIKDSTDKGAVFSFSETSDCSSSSSIQTEPIKEYSLSEFLSKYEYADIDILLNNPKEFLMDYYELRNHLTWGNFQGDEWYRRGYEERQQQVTLFNNTVEIAGLSHVDILTDFEIRIKYNSYYNEGVDIDYWKCGIIISKEMIHMFGEASEIKIDFVKASEDDLYKFWSDGQIELQCIDNYYQEAKKTVSKDNWYFYELTCNDLYLGASNNELYFNLHIKSHYDY